MSLLSRVIFCITLVTCFSAWFYNSARFEGSLNVDLNEITFMNLVPFPKLHYLVSSQTPLFSLSDVHLPSRRLDQMFSDAFSRDHQLIKGNPKHSLYLACTLMVRGHVEISDVRRNIERYRTMPAHIHHYTSVEGMGIGDFTDSIESLNSLVEEYRGLERQMNNPPPQEPRLEIMK